jgi:hypothetical protein
MNDTIKVTGRLRTRIYENDILILDDTSKNLVVDLGLQNIAQLLGGGTGVILNKGSVGDSGAAPAPGDTTLSNSFNATGFVITYPANNSIQLDFAIEKPEYNGNTIREYGLLDANGNLFSRIVKAPFAKTAVHRLECQWIIDFTN